MAVTLDKKAETIAMSVVQQTTAMINAMNALEALEAERSDAGIDLTQYDAVYAANAQTEHVDGDILNGVINTSIPNIKTYMDANGHSTNLQKATRGTR